MITDITLRKRGSFSNSPAARRVRRDFGTWNSHGAMLTALRALAQALEIEASKRGNLLTAAFFAEFSEVRQ